MKEKKDKMGSDLAFREGSIGEAAPSGEEIGIKLSNGVRGQDRIELNSEEEEERKGIVFGRI